MLCFLLLSSYPLHLYVFVIICQYGVVLLERTNKYFIIIKYTSNCFLLATYIFTSLCTCIFKIE